MEDDSYLVRATANRAALQLGPGYCVFCLGKVLQVRRWIADAAGDTAICPHCAIDAVVALSDIKDGGSATRRLQILRKWHEDGFPGIDVVTSRSEHLWMPDGSEEQTLTDTGSLRTEGRATGRRGAAPPAGTGAAPAAPSGRSAA